MYSSLVSNRDKLKTARSGEEGSLGLMSVDDEPGKKVSVILRDYFVLLRAPVVDALGCFLEKLVDGLAGAS